MQQSQIHERRIQHNVAVVRDKQSAAGIKLWWIMKLHFPGGVQQEHVNKRLGNALLKLPHRGHRIQGRNQFIDRRCAEHPVEFRMPVDFRLKKCRCLRDFGIFQRAHVGQRIVVHLRRNSGAI